MSLLEFITNPYILALLCAGCIFAEMFLAKKVYLPLTAKIKNAKVRTAINIVFGLITCFALSAGQMYALCDVLPGAVFAWKWVIASTLGATLFYLIIEKIFGNAVVNELGNVLANYISRSDMFDGKISENGMVEIAKKLLERVTNHDNEIASKETKAIDEVVKRLDGFLADGKVTEEEKVAATELINAHNIDVNNSTYEKYKALLNK